MLNVSQATNLIEEARIIKIKALKTFGATWFCMYLMACMVRGGKSSGGFEFQEPYHVTYIEGGMMPDEFEKRLAVLGVDQYRDRIKLFLFADILKREKTMATLRDPALNYLIEDSLSIDAPNANFYDSTKLLFNKSENPDEAETDPLKKILQSRNSGVKQIFVDDGGFELPDSYADLELTISPLPRRNKQLTFQVAFSKARNHEVPVDNLRTMVLTLEENDNGILHFKHRSTKEYIKTIALKMALKGINQEVISEEVGRHQSTISRWLKDFEMMGVCERKGHELTLTNKGKAWFREYDGFLD